MYNISLFFIVIAFCFQNSYAQINNNKKILIVATSADNLLSKPNDHTWGSYAPEISEFYSVMYSAGFRAKDIDIVSPKGGAIPIAVSTIYPKKYHIDEKDKAILESKLKNTLHPFQVNYADYNVIYYSGGFSCLVDYPRADSIGALAAKIYENGGIVGAVCDGIAGLIPVSLSSNQSLVMNRTITTNGYKNKTDTVSKQLVRKGAIISSEALISENRIVTAHGVRPRTVAAEILKLLGYPVEKP